MKNGLGVILSVPKNNQKLAPLVGVEHWGVVCGIVKVWIIHIY